MGKYPEKESALVLDDSKLPFDQVFQIDSSDLYHINRNLDIRMAV